MPQNQTAYSSDDLQGILKIALSRQQNQGEFSWGDLVEIAGELGLTPGDLVIAEKEWQAKQTIQAKQAEFDLLRQRQLGQRVGRYLLIGSACVGLNALMGWGTPWSLYVLLGLSLRLSLQAWVVYQPKGEAYEQAFQRWYRQHQFRGWLSRWTSRLLQSTLPQ
ncbi:2TM domain-containing protein [Synechococcus sp. PCC 6312]|uniref:2TM domain-containing protein n=1 Tax=Synechococcus sp. (strain ATCC 27167 / PCC 6312) TaxID=195253 RepID=UPI00029EC4D2|nr:2TM domain-containing protein [Synechococcus sp. PCC 6312]AFY59841.1 hypothetical protein Syn6312_0620 [Synechococcus sp. PCC 6312]